MRVIAQKANVDAALIHHFFISKEGVFAAAVEDSFRLAELIDKVLAESADNVGERLVAGFLELCAADETREPMLAVIRSAFSYEDAARLLQDFVRDQVIARLLPASDQKDARLRATFVGSQLIGMAILRYIVKIEPLASADPELIAKFLGITIDRYLYKDINPPGAATQGDGPRNSAAGPYPSLPFKQGSGAMRKPPVRRDGGEHDDNRLAILHAACAELALHGYEGASVRSIARRARVDSAPCVLLLSIEDRPRYRGASRAPGRCGLDTGGILRLSGARARSGVALLVRAHSGWPVDRAERARRLQRDHRRDG